MATWAVQRAGNWNTLSDNPASPWHDGGAQTALASIPQKNDTITNAGAFALTFDCDFPDTANVLDTDTVNRVAGSFNEASRNTDPGTSNVQSGVIYKICNVTKTGASVSAGLTGGVTTLSGTIKMGRSIGPRT